MYTGRVTLLVLCTAALLSACPPAPEPEPEPPAERQVPPPTFLDGGDRVVSMGDVHGDLAAAQGALRLAGAIDEDDDWIGGELVVVQVGDQLDRGEDEEAILELFERLGQEAFDAGGGFYSLLGNHEIMNVELDLRYVWPEGFTDFADTEYDPEDPELLTYPEEERGRVAAFRPGGEWAVQLAGHNVMMVVGDTAFVHGGILPEHVEYGLERANAEVQEWMEGTADEPWEVTDGDGPVWVRDYSDGPADCATLEEALDALGATRMVVAHTVQSQVNDDCDEQVWRVDVGMSEHYGGPIQAILIEDDEVTILD